MESKLQADPLRHYNIVSTNYDYNNNLFLRNQDHPRNFKQMSFIRSHAPTVRGVASVRLIDVYNKEERTY